MSPPTSREAASSRGRPTCSSSRWLVCLLVAISVWACRLEAAPSGEQTSTTTSAKTKPSSSPDAIQTSTPTKTADLRPLISESLAINKRLVLNTSTGGSSAAAAPVDQLPANASLDEWSFERVEYDLMEFLEDLGARYENEAKAKANNNNNNNNNRSHDAHAQVEARAATPSGQLAVSLAPVDSELAESSWQYGIFDRFTRARVPPTRPPPPGSGSGLEPPNRKEALDVGAFNSAECGLRFYIPDSQVGGGALLGPTSELDDSDQIVQELAQRRQRPPTPLGALAGAPDDQLSDQPPPDPSEEAYESYKAALEANSAAATPPELNLNQRRLWLQHQVGQTLHLLGFNNHSAVGNHSELFGFGRESPQSGVGRERLPLHLLKKAAGRAELGTSSGAPAPAAAPDELKLEARVIGGSDARLGDSPWSVSLQALVSRPGTGGLEYRHYCGGTIIGERYVLTAAHCLDFMVGREARLFVVLGDLNWRMSAGSLHGRRLAVEKLIIHSGYKSTAFGHDLGLVRTREPIRPLKVNGRYLVNSVCLPQPGVEHSGEAELVGWGLFSNRNEMADSLQIAEVPILPRPLCVDLYRRRTGLIQWLIGIELITDKQVCAGTFGRGICQGDSGSALVVNERIPADYGGRSRRQVEPPTQPASPAPTTEANLAPRHRPAHSDQTRATIIGIVAFGGIRRCSYQSLPGVYMQTSKYLDWILPRAQP